MGFTSGTSGGSGNEGDAGDEGGIRRVHGGKQEIIINNNYYEKYRSHEQIEIEKTTLENVSDATDNCDATKALTTTDMKSDEEESSLENNSEFGLDQIGSNLSKMDQNGSSAKDPIIALLSEYCHSKVLNIDYLLGKSSQPFTNKAASSAK